MSKDTDQLRRIADEFDRLWQELDPDTTWRDWLLSLNEKEQIALELTSATDLLAASTHQLKVILQRLADTPPQAK